MRIVICEKTVELVEQRRVNHDEGECVIEELEKRRRLGNLKLIEEIPVTQRDLRESAKRLCRERCIERIWV